MARPQKQGIDYFPLDVDMDQDDKVELIEAKFGLMGFGILVKLLMKIYKEGYFYEWTEKEQLIFSRRINVDINLVNGVINECIKWNFFNSELYKKYKILTSKGIQKRYLEATGRRKQVEIQEEYLLNSINTKKYPNVVIVSNNPINVDINLVNENINPQSKVKESKVNNIDDDDARAREEKIENKYNNVAEISAGLIQHETSQLDADSNDSLPSAVLGDSGAVPEKKKPEIEAEPNKGILQIERHYAANVLNRLSISSKDMSYILEVYEKGYPVDFIINCINIGCERYRKSNNGMLDIKSFKYFIPIIEDEWKKKQLREAASINPSSPSVNTAYFNNKGYTKPNKLTRFHTSEQRTSRYTAGELEEIARRRREGS